MNTIYGLASGTIVDTIDGGIAIDKLPKNGSIRSNDGLDEPFVGTIVNGGIPTVILTLSTGEEIICSMDLLFLGADGWVEAQNTKGMFLFDYEQKNEISVDSIRNGGRRKVFFPAIESGSFCLANGLIVSNSDEVEYQVTKPKKKYLQPVKGEDMDVEVFIPEEGEDSKLYKEDV